VAGEYLEMYKVRFGHFALISIIRITLPYS